MLCESHGRQRRHHDREERQAGNRLNDGGRAEHRLLEPPPPGHEHARRDAEGDSDEQRQERELEVRGQVARQEGELLAHAGLSSSSVSTIRA